MKRNEVATCTGRNRHRLDMLEMHRSAPGIVRGSPAPTPVASPQHQMRPSAESAQALVRPTVARTNSTPPGSATFTGTGLHGAGYGEAGSALQSCTGWPVPRVPSTLVPQQYTSPSVVTPQATARPMSTCLKAWPPCTGVGRTSTSTSFASFPISPIFSSPQQYAAPAAVSAQVPSNPDAM